LCSFDAHVKGHARRRGALERSRRLHNMSHDRNIHDHEVAFIVSNYLAENGFSATLKSFQAEAQGILSNVRRPATSAKSLKSLLGEYLSLKAADVERQYLFSQPNRSAICGQIVTRIDNLLADYQRLVSLPSVSSSSMAAGDNAEPRHFTSSTNQHSATSASRDQQQSAHSFAKRKRKRPPRRASRSDGNHSNIFGVDLDNQPIIPGSTIGLLDLDPAKIAAQINNSSRDGLETFDGFDDPFHFLNDDALAALERDGMDGPRALSRASTPGGGGGGHQKAPTAVRERSSGDVRTSVGTAPVSHTATEPQTQSSKRSDALVTPPTSTAAASAKSGALPRDGNRNVQTQPESPIRIFEGVERINKLTAQNRAGMIHLLTSDTQAAPRDNHRSATAASSAASRATREAAVAAPAPAPTTKSPTVPTATTAAGEAIPENIDAFLDTLDYS